MGDIFLSDDIINGISNENKELDNYNQKVYKYYKLTKLYKEQIKEYQKLIIELNLECKKLKIVIDNYKENINNIDKYLCKVCYNNYSDCIIIPCMHFICCEECINKLESNKCPMCREDFKKYLKLFT